MKATNKSLGGGAVLAAVVASLCCIIPILFAGAGATAIVLAGKFAAIRPYLLAITGLLLLAGFYFAYRPTNATCAPDSSCAIPASLRRARLGFCLATAFAVVLTTIPYWSPALMRSRATKLSTAATQVSGLPLQKTRLHISGMFCEACAAGIENALRAQRGVRSASVVFSKSEAEVEYDPSQVSLLQIQALIEKEGYQVTGVLPPSGREG